MPRLTLPKLLKIILLSSGLVLQGYAQLMNTDFEKGLEGWSLFVPGESKDKGCGMEEGPGHQGKGARLKSSSQARWGLGGRAVQVNAGEKWQLTYWIKNETAKVSSGVPGFGARLTMNDNSGKSTDNHLYLFPSGEIGLQQGYGTYKGAHLPPAEWTKVTGVFEIPKGVFQMSLTFMPNGLTGSFLLDDVSLQKVSDNTPLSPITGSATVTPTKTAPTSSVVELSPDLPSLTPTPERINEIAGLLSAKPFGMCKPITDRNAWEGITSTLEGKNYIKQAEQRLLTKPPVLTEELYTIYARKGTRPEWENPYADKLNRVLAFALAECLENKGRFIESIEKELPSILEEGTWCSAAHSGGNGKYFTGEIEVAKQMFDLGAAARAGSLATLSYMLGDKLSKELHSQIYAEIKRRAWDPYLTRASNNAVEGWWWMNGINNWNAVVSCGIVGSALTLIEDPKLRAEFIAISERGMKYYMSGLADDGFCDEGVGYWHYGFGQYMIFQELIRQQTAGKIDAFAENKTFLCATYPFRMEIGNSIYPAFGDSGVNSVLEMDYGAYVARRYGIRQDILGANLKRHPNYNHPLGNHLARFGIAWFCDDVPKAPCNITPDLTLGGTRDAFEEGGVWVFRPKINNPFGLAIAIKGGNNNENHNHDDMGSYTIINNGQNLLTDPGMDAYTKDTFSQKRYESEVINSFGHPVPVVDHFLQSDKLAPAMAKERKANHAEVVSKNYTESEDKLTLDLSSGYSYNVPSLKKLHRTYVYTRVKDSGSIEIIDEVEFSEAKDFGSAVITRNAWKELDKNVFRVNNSSGAVKIKVTAEGGTLVLDTRDKLKSFSTSGWMSVNRLGFNFEKPVTKAKIIYHIEPEQIGASGVRTAQVNNDGKISSDSEKPVIHLEAENFTKEKNGSVEIVSGKTGATGKAFKSWDNEGHTLSWQLEVPTSGFYALRLKYCGQLTEPSKRSIQIDNKPAALANYAFSSTGGWSSGTDDWKVMWFGETDSPTPLYLEAGKRELTIINQGGPLNLDWLELVPLSKTVFNFEDGFLNWTVGDKDLSTINTNSDHTGKVSVRVNDNVENDGSSLYSKRLPLKADQVVQASMWANLLNSDNGLGLYIKFYDSAGKNLNAAPNENRTQIETRTGWVECKVEAKAPSGTAFVDLWIHSFNKNKPLVDIDDVTWTIK